MLVNIPYMEHLGYNCQDADNMLSLEIVCAVSKNQGELRTALDCVEASSALPEVKIQLDQIFIWGPLDPLEWFFPCIS